MNLYTVSGVTQCIYVNNFKIHNKKYKIKRSKILFFTQIRKLLQ